MTERSSYTFTVKENGDGTPFVMLEPNYENLPLLRSGFISFDLKEGATYEEAQGVARYLNQHVENLAYTPLT